MKNSIAQILLFTYPDLLRSGSRDAQIDIQPGWLCLVNNLCWNLRTYLQFHPEFSDFCITRITKDKGELAIHCQGDNPTLFSLIETAREQARLTCEYDGNPAAGLYVCAPNWFRYLCSSCAELHDCARYSDFKDNFEPYEATGPV